MNTKVELDDSERRAMRLLTSEEREIVVEQVLESARAELEWVVRLAVARALQGDTMEILLEDLELVGETPRAARPMTRTPRSARAAPRPVLTAPRPPLARSTPRTSPALRRPAK